MLPRRASETVKVVLVGSKADLAAQRVVTEDEGRYASLHNTPKWLLCRGVLITGGSLYRQQAEEWGVPYMECSAKTGEGVDQAFLTAVELVVGGWSKVVGMAIPRHVPSEAFLAHHLPETAPSSGALATTDNTGAISRRCCLQ
jgi:GTPase SAR1 family protein